MRLLIIDDEANIRKTTAIALEGMGYETLGAETSAVALKNLDGSHFDVAFLDLKLGSENGLDVLPKLLKINPRLDIVVFTAFSTIENAVEAIRAGAVDFLAKPFTPDQLRQVLSKIVQRRKLEGRVAELETRLSTDSPTTDLTTSEPAVQRVFEIAFKAAGSPATIMILGESGTGKTVLARTIHENSPQRENAFVTVSCPSLSRELLESELFGHVKGAFTGAITETWGKVSLADGGTLFMDEIGDLPLEIQPKLLRLLQEKEYERVGENKIRHANVRVIAATNRNLEQAVQEGKFREDLFYRLNVISLSLPPLRERSADVQRIANGYLRFFAKQCGKQIKGFSPAAEQAVQNYNWPGNLRELRNIVERAVILAGGSQLEVIDLPDKMSQSVLLNESRSTHLGALITLEELENEHIRKVIERTTTMEEAAQILGIDPATLYRKRKKISL
ncbi:sigma-54-dependent transcriptional regulator [Pedosphaera parvula]|uniref:Two component, sigma54 specific, transcriptional regulator, Fis family n=1 Tax=Pedosphaera parvula (strain Ellin514) TaxID=320771 RepID=B9XIV9_PEDPL|nr:sigma-54 dependent transcriptional regulator [Pedosphaera parvula]EEF60186.1 two component, sigma54 specific, transcriptional regulator, Fis family [Pedosphaera parvula Ellin514]